MIPELLHGFRGDAGELLIAAPLQGLGLEQREDAEEELPDDGDGEVALRQLDEQRVSELHGIAQIRECIGVAPLSLDLCRKPEQERRLADEVERDVRQRDVLLEDRRMAAPLGETMAEDEPIVAETKQILEGRVHMRIPRGTL